jgi:hypothetical protein
LTEVALIITALKRSRIRRSNIFISGIKILANPTIKIIKLSKIANIDASVFRERLNIKTKEKIGILRKLYFRTNFEK